MADEPSRSPSHKVKIRKDSFSFKKLITARLSKQSTKRKVFKFKKRKMNKMSEIEFYEWLGQDKVEKDDSEIPLWKNVENVVSEFVYIGLY